MRRLLLALLLSALCLPLWAAEVRPVEIKAQDGLILKGSFHASGNEKGRAVLLLHAMNSNREGWSGVIAPLLQAGISVLAVDQRGYGETGGSLDFGKHGEDARLWMDWLRKQPGIEPDRIGLAGASMGADAGLSICAQDPQCITAIALSPNRSFELQQLDYSGRSLLVLAANRDKTSFLSAQAIFVQAKGDVAVHIVEGSAHGMATLFDDERSRIPEIVSWLDYHL